MRSRTRDLSSWGLVLVLTLLHLLSRTKLLSRDGRSFNVVVFWGRVRVEFANRKGGERTFRAAQVHVDTKPGCPLSRLLRRRHP